MSLHNKRIITFYSLLIFILFLSSSYIWFAWSGRDEIISFVCSLILAFFCVKGKLKLKFDKRNVIAFVCIAIPLYVLHPELSFFRYILLTLPYFFIVMSDQIMKVLVIRNINKWFSYILIPSIFLFILLLFADLPSFGTVELGDVNHVNDGYGSCKNYIFYVKSTFDTYDTRFNGPFLEPGHLGSILAFLLLINRYDFKRTYNWVFLISLLLTQSLAGYVLAFLGFWLIRFYEGKTKFKNILLYLLLFCTVYVIAITYNDGDNVLYEKIFSRLEYDEDNGFTGNNRVSSVIYAYFLTMWDDADTALFGNDLETMEILAESGERGTGFVYWTVSHGLIGLLGAALFYIYVSLSSSQKRFALLLFIFLCFMFWQRSKPFWYSWIICYYYGLAIEEQYKAKQNKSKKINKYENRNINISSES